MSGSAETVVLRPIRPEDADFLFRVYASTREEELAPVPWTVEQKQAFLRAQFEAQRAWWTENYPNARFDVVEVDGQPAGRLYVDVWPDEVRIVDIALLPQHRGAGVGKRLLNGVIAEADSLGRPVSIHVEANNPARTLYDRLGFRVVGEEGVYLRMERPVSAPRGH